MSGLYLALVLLLLFLSHTALLEGQAVVATSVAQADRECETCHREIYQSYLKTPMANASGLASSRLIPGNFHNAASGVDYTIHLDKDEPRLSFHAAQKSGTTPTVIAGSEVLQYYLGSGHIGATYLYTRQGYVFESPIAYYQKLAGYGMKPGLETSPQILAGLPINDACLRCHMSGAKQPDAGTENHFSELAFAHTGITCEACHGSAVQHVNSGGKSTETNPTALGAIRRDSVCIVCHLEGDTNVERKRRYVTDFKPGEDIRDYMTYFTYRGETGTSRAVSEVEQFTASRCKLASGDQMSCTSCHDPHRSPDQAERAGYFRSKCLACHTGQQFASEHHSENKDCTSCHMPRTESRNIAHVAWTDHRIRRVPDEAEAPETEKGLLQNGVGMELRSLYSSAGERDLGLAYYNLVVRGDTTRIKAAMKMLSAANKEDSADLPVLRALGVLAQMEGDNGTAEVSYRAILNLDPDNLTARTNLGTLLAKSGRITEAIRLWKPTFERNEDLASLGVNLALAQCISGNSQQAEITLRRVLVYNPVEKQLTQLLAEIESGRRVCLAAAQPAHGLP